jgi:hypothetical protein
MYFAHFLADSWRCSLMQSTTGAGDRMCVSWLLKYRTSIEPGYVAIA